MTRSAITPAVLEWTEQGHPYSTQFADIYFSNADGLQESQYVFLQQNQLPQRILTHAEQRPFRITSYNVCYTKLLRSGGFNCKMRHF